MDLIEAPLAVAAASVLATYQTIAADSAAVLDWHEVETPAAAFSLLDSFDNVASQIVLLPTKGRWTVTLTNSLLCDGFDSLCHYLTRFHGLTTIHWSAHDEWTTMQSGAMFHWRRAEPDGGLTERRVQAAQQDREWHFFEQGSPLDQEDLSAYLVRKKRDRLDEAKLMALLDRLGAHPWHIDSYDLPGRVARIARPVPPLAIVRPAQEVIHPQ